MHETKRRKKMENLDYFENIKVTFLALGLLGMSLKQKAMIWKGV